MGSNFWDRYEAWRPPKFVGPPEPRVKRRKKVQPLPIELESGPDLDIFLSRASDKKDRLVHEAVLSLMEPPSPDIFEEPRFQTNLSTLEGGPRFMGPPEPPYGGIEPADNETSMELASLYGLGMAVGAPLERIGFDLTASELEAPPDEGLLSGFGRRMGTVAKIPYNVAKDVGTGAALAFSSPFMEPETRSAAIEGINEALPTAQIAMASTDDPLVQMATQGGLQMADLGAEALAFLARSPRAAMVAAEEAPRLAQAAAEASKADELDELASLGRGAFDEVPGPEPIGPPQPPNFLMGSEALEAGRQARMTPEEAAGRLLGPVQGEERIPISMEEAEQAIMEATAPPSITRQLPEPPPAPPSASGRPPGLGPGDGGSTPPGGIPEVYPWDDATLTPSAFIDRLKAAKLNAAGEVTDIRPKHAELTLEPGELPGFHDPGSGLTINMGEADAVLGNLKKAFKLKAIEKGIIPDDGTLQATKAALVRDEEGLLRGVMSSAVRDPNAVQRLALIGAVGASGLGALAEEDDEKRKNYGMGALLLGAGVLKMHPSLSRVLGAADATELVRRAMKATGRMDREGIAGFIIERTKGAVKPEHANELAELALKESGFSASGFNVARAVADEGGTPVQAKRQIEYLNDLRRTDTKIGEPVIDAQIRATEGKDPDFYPEAPAVGKPGPFRDELPPLPPKGTAEYAELYNKSRPYTIKGYLDSETALLPTSWAYSMDHAVRRDEAGVRLANHISEMRRLAQAIPDRIRKGPNKLLDEVLGPRYGLVFRNEKGYDEVLSAVPDWAKPYLIDYRQNKLPPDIVAKLQADPAATAAAEEWSDWMKVYLEDKAVNTRLPDWKKSKDPGYVPHLFEPETIASHRKEMLDAADQDLQAARGTPDEAKLVARWERLKNADIAREAGTKKAIADWEAIPQEGFLGNMLRRESNFEDYIRDPARFMEIEARRYATKVYRDQGLPPALEMLDEYGGYHTGHPQYPPLWEKYKASIITRQEKIRKALAKDPQNIALKAKLQAPHDINRLADALYNQWAKKKGKPPIEEAMVPGKRGPFQPKLVAEAAPSGKLFGLGKKSLHWLRPDEQLYLHRQDYVKNAFGFATRKEVGDRWLAYHFKDELATLNPDERNRLLNWTRLATTKIFLDLNPGTPLVNSLQPVVNGAPYLGGKWLAAGSAQTVEHFLKGGRFGFSGDQAVRDLSELIGIEQFDPKWLQSGGDLVSRPSVQKSLDAAIRYTALQNWTEVNGKLAVGIGRYEQFTTLAREVGRIASQAGLGKDAPLEAILAALEPHVGRLGNRKNALFVEDATYRPLEQLKRAALAWKGDTIRTSAATEGMRTVDAVMLQQGPQMASRAEAGSYGHAVKYATMLMHYIPSEMNFFWSKLTPKGKLKMFNYTMAVGGPKAVPFFAIGAAMVPGVDDYLKDVYDGKYGRQASWIFKWNIIHALGRETPRAMNPIGLQTPGEFTPDVESGLGKALMQVSAYGGVLGQALLGRGLPSVEKSLALPDWGGRLEVAWEETKKHLNPGDPAASKSMLPPIATVGRFFEPRPGMTTWDSLGYAVRFKPTWMATGERLADRAAKYQEESRITTNLIAELTSKSMARAYFEDRLEAAGMLPGSGKRFEEEIAGEGKTTLQRLWGSVPVNPRHLEGILQDLDTAVMLAEEKPEVYTSDRDFLFQRVHNGLLAGIEKLKRTPTDPRFAKYREAFEQIRGVAAERSIPLEEYKPQATSEEQEGMRTLRAWVLQGDEDPMKLLERAAKIRDKDLRYKIEGIVKAGLKRGTYKDFLENLKRAGGP